MKATLNRCDFRRDFKFTRQHAFLISAGILFKNVGAAPLILAAGRCQKTAQARMLIHKFSGFEPNKIPHLIQSVSLLADTDWTISNYSHATQIAKVY